jgi:hypothetical protein
VTQQVISMFGATNGITVLTALPRVATSLMAVGAAEWPRATRGDVA